MNLEQFSEIPCSTNLMNSVNITVLREKLMATKQFNHIYVRAMW